MLDILSRVAVDVVLSPGDILLVKNLSTVHGRRGYDGPATTAPGQHRWMRRLWIASEPQHIDRVRRAPGRVLGSQRGPRTGAPTKRAAAHPRGVEAIPKLHS